MTFGSLFDGIGCFSLGFQRVGFDLRWVVEIEEDCRRVTRERFPQATQHEDVRNVGRANLVPVDCIIGGFPCTDLSVAGRRAGLAGERSGLWFEFARVLGEMRPAWVLIENVPGLVSSWSPVEPPPDPLGVGRGGNPDRLGDGAVWEVEETSDLETVLNDLGQLGYWWAWRSLDCQYYGLAQRRERVFIVARLGDGGGLAGAEPRGDARRLRGLPFKVLFEPACLPGHPPPSRQAGEDVAGSPGGGTARRSWANDLDRGWANDLDRSGAFVPDVAFCLPASGRGTGDGHGQGWNSNYVAAFGGNNTSGPIDVATAVNACKTASGRQDFESETFVVGALQAHSKRHGHAMTTQQAAEEGHLNAHALRSEGADAGEDGTGRGTPLVTAYVHPRVLRNSDSSFSGMMVRRLTPTECLRLMGLPDWWLNIDPPLSDSAKYRMIGNGGAVPVVEWIARRILEIGGAQ